MDLVSLDCSAQFVSLLLYHEHVSKEVDDVFVFSCGESSWSSNYSIFKTLYTDTVRFPIFRQCEISLVNAWMGPVYNTTF